MTVKSVKGQAIETIFSGALFTRPMDLVKFNKYLKHILQLVVIFLKEHINSND